MEGRHVLGGAFQNADESVLVELFDDERDRKDHLLFVDTERIGVYGNERLLNDRNPRSCIFGVSMTT